MKVESATFHVYGDHGRAVVHFVRRRSEWAVSVTIGKTTTQIEQPHRDPYRPCPTHSLIIVSDVLNRQKTEAAK